MQKYMDCLTACPLFAGIGENDLTATLSCLGAYPRRFEKGDVLLIPAKRILHPCDHPCGDHHQMIYNLMRILAMKNLAFHRRSEITAQRTTRGKLMTFLLLEAKRAGSCSFTIPFDRQELADYLGVDRSGLSAQIGALRREGVLSCERSRFTLHIGGIDGQPAAGHSDLFPVPPGIPGHAGDQLDQA